MTDQKTDIILASSSPYRQQLLSRLNLPFRCQSPAIDESPLLDEAPEALAIRLSLQKAQAVYQNNPEALIIASDQVAVCHGRIIGKPGSRERAIEQLQQASAQPVTFLTGLCLMGKGLVTPRLATIPYTVHFRPLSLQEITRYIEADQPLDCAGSFKWERLGISLFARMEGDDPTALEGLPLITLCQWLREQGQNIP